MSMRTQLKICVLGATALLASCSTQKEENVNLSVEQSTINNVDKSINPGDDFYSFATNNWIKNNPRPEFWPMWSPSIIEDDKRKEKFVEEIQKCASASNVDGTVEKIIGDFYSMYMDTVRLKADGTKPILPYLQKISSVDNKKDLIKLVAEEHSNWFFEIWVGPDPKDNKNNLVSIQMPSRMMEDYVFLGTNDYLKNIRSAYEKMIDDAFVLCGYDRDKAVELRTKALNIKTQLASCTVDRNVYQDPTNYHKMSVKQATDSIGGFDMNQYLKDYGFDQTEIVNVNIVEPLKNGCRVLTDASLDDLKAYIQCRMICDNMIYLGPELEQVWQKYLNVLSNNEDKTPRWKKSYNVAEVFMPEVLGHFYVNKFFSEKKREKVLDMIKYLKLAMNETIDEQDWMNDATKQEALDKLNVMEAYVGYGSCFIDYSYLSFSRDVSLFENVRNYKKHVWEWYKTKNYNKPVDKGLWLIHPHVVNAYYHPYLSNINIMAAYLEKPRFDENADDVYNYAMTGSTIGHEITHGFDSNGRKLDKNGAIRDWWTAEDSNKFNALCESYVAYFDTLKVLPDVNCNGKLTLSENIADLGGLKAAFRALQLANADKKLEDKYGYTPEQRFFIYYANLWYIDSNEEFLRNKAMFDEHAVPSLRVNGPLPHIDEWYDAFDIKPGDKMYIPKERRVKIW